MPTPGGHPLPLHDALPIYEAQGSPLAEAIFAIPGADVAEIIVSGNLVTVVKQSAAPWPVVGKAVGQAIRSTLAGDRPASVERIDRKSTRLNSSHPSSSYADPWRSPSSPTRRSSDL